MFIFIPVFRINMNKYFVTINIEQKSVKKGKTSDKSLTAHLNAHLVATQRGLEKWEQRREGPCLLM